MDSLVGYGSDDENESERYGSQLSMVGTGGSSGLRRRDDDTNYDDVNMDMSEESQDAESEPELPPAEPSPPPQPSRNERRGSNDSRERDRDRDRGRDRDSERKDRRRDSPPRSRSDRDRSDRRSPRRDDRHARSERDRAGGRSEARRGLLGDRPDDKVPALMDLKPFGGDLPPGLDKRSQDARDAVSPRFVDRDRRDRDRDRERDRDRNNRRSEERRSTSHRHERRDRSRSRSRGAPPAHPSSSSSSGERRSPSGDYRPSSYKVNKKLEVMEKMGLQIKTPDGSMATAQQLRAAAHDAPRAPGAALPSYYNPSAVNATKILDQVQKRKLLWANKNKTEAEEAAKWSGTRFAQDADGKQVSKFMRLMGIKEPAAVNNEPDKAVDPIKKQEDLFQAMQAQYEVARATTHTMRGVGLGFQRGQY